TPSVRVAGRARTPAADETAPPPLAARQGAQRARAGPNTRREREGASFSRSTDGREIAAHRLCEPLHQHETQPGPAKAAGDAFAPPHKQPKQPPPLPARHAAPPGHPPAERAEATAP